MSYSVQQIQEERESFGPYRYCILKNGSEFAIFWHDYRGECGGLELIHGASNKDFPFGICSNFLIGGGPLPLGLTKKAMSYLDQLSHENSNTQPDAPV